MSLVKQTAKQKREVERLEQKFQAEKSIRLLHAMAKAESLDVKASVYYRYDNVLYYEFNFSRADFPNSLNVFQDPYEELTSWGMDCIDNQLQMVHDRKNKQRRLNDLKKEVLARLTDEEKEALGI